MNKNKKGAFLIDRDGVMIEMVYYKNREIFDSPQRVKDVKLVKGVDKIIKWANKRNILVIEISNQPGVAKGKMGQKTSDSIEDKTHKLLKEKNAKVDRAYICLHHPQGVVKELTSECDCRKPKPGLLLRAAKEMKIDLKKSVFLGDKKSDMDASKSVGCTSVLLLHDNDLLEKVTIAKKVPADFKIKSLEEMIPILKKILD